MGASLSRRRLLLAGLVCALAGCVGIPVGDPLAGPIPEAVDVAVGFMPITGVPEEESRRVLSQLQRSDLFKEVRETPSFKRQQGVDVYLTVVNNFGGLKAFDRMRPDVTILSAYSRKPLRTWKAMCGGRDSYCLNGTIIARELAAILAPGSEALAALMAERGALAPPPASAAAPAQPAPAAILTSDVDHPAARKAEDPRNFALVIGVGTYRSLPEAKFAVRDAETVRDHLIALGYPKRNVILLTGDSATRTGIQKYLEEWLPRNVPEGGRVFFYYSGHGAPDTKTGEAHLVSWDGDPQFLQSTTYPVAKLYASLSKLRAAEVTAVVDSCFSGAGGRSVLPGGARPLVASVDLGVPPRGRLTVFTAASGDEITGALDEQGHGMFTYFFLKGLSGAAADASGAVSARALLDYLKPKVRDEARRQNREQTPLLLGWPDAELLAP